MCEGRGGRVCEWVWMGGVITHMLIATRQRLGLWEFGGLLKCERRVTYMGMNGGI